jgi:hypothetical protein
VQLTLTKIIFRFPSLVRVAILLFFKTDILHFKQFLSVKKYQKSYKNGSVLSKAIKHYEKKYRKIDKPNLITIKTDLKSLQLQFI